MIKIDKIFFYFWTQLYLFIFEIFWVSIVAFLSVFKKFSICFIHYHEWMSSCKKKQIVVKAEELVLGMANIRIFFRLIYLKLLQRNSS